VPEPFPIFKLAERFLIYDADTVAYVRREHNICGVLIGGLAQAPQQSVFLGLPLQLLPEEARLLVDKGVSYLVDDVLKHKRGFLQAGLSPDERKAYHAALRKQGLTAASAATKRSDDRKKAALKQRFGSEVWNDVPDDMLKPGTSQRAEAANSHPETQEQPYSADHAETIFESTAPSDLRKLSTSRAAGPAEVEPFAVTPPISYPPLRSSPPSDESGDMSVPDVPQSYPIFKYLHNQGYFLAPGLRFGCKYMAYPGDPLRFHSHFLVNGMDWDQEFDLLDIVAGGRLGTGVKKGFLLGGQEADDRFGSKGQGKADSGDDETDDCVRAFCIEWGGM
jgi:tRNA-splicing endonuclease subunit Sen34